jgi:hypothetical protein
VPAKVLKLFPIGGKNSIPRPGKPKDKKHSPQSIETAEEEPKLFRQD